MTKQPLSESVSLSELQYMRDEEGLSYSAIAKRLDISPATVSRYLGPKKPLVKNKRATRARLTQEEIDEIRRLHGMGRSVSAISAKTGVYGATVKKYIDKPWLNAKPAEPEGTNIVELPVTQLEPKQQDVVEPVMEQNAEPEIEQSVTIEAQKVTIEEEKDMLEITSARTTIKLKGAECRYEVVVGDGGGDVTIWNGNAEVMICDKDSLRGFINELERISQYLTGGPLAVMETKKAG